MSNSSIGDCELLIRAINEMSKRSCSRLRRSLPLAVAIASLALGAEAQSPPSQVQLPPNAEIGDYVGQDVMIPMRDGAKLHAEIWRPKTATGPLPILIQRSPYGFGMARVGASFAAEYSQLAK